MPAIVLSSKGQLVIPLEIRRRLGLDSGSRLSCELDNGRILLVPETGKQARLKRGRDGMPVLVAPKSAPRMSVEAVKAALAEFP